jgi:hypothetical protein
VRLFRVVARDQLSTRKSIGPPEAAIVDIVEVAQTRARQAEIRPYMQAAEMRAFFQHALWALRLRFEELAGEVTRIDASTVFLSSNFVYIEGS